MSDLNQFLEEAVEELFADAFQLQLKSEVDRHLEGRLLVVSREVRDELLSDVANQVNLELPSSLKRRVMGYFGAKFKASVAFQVKKAVNGRDFREKLKTFPQCPNCCSLLPRQLELFTGSYL